MKVSEQFQAATFLIPVLSLEIMSLQMYLMPYKVPARLPLLKTAQYYAQFSGGEWQKQELRYMAGLLDFKPEERINFTIQQLANALDTFTRSFEIQGERKREAKRALQVCNAYLRQIKGMGVKIEPSLAMRKAFNPLYNLNFEEA